MSEILGGRGLFHRATDLWNSTRTVCTVPVPGHRPHYGVQQEVWNGYLRLTNQLYLCLFGLAGSCPCTRTSMVGVVYNGDHWALQNVIPYIIRVRCILLKC